MAYTPPSLDEVDFELEEYTAPSLDEVDFEFGTLFDESYFDGVSATESYSNSLAVFYSDSILGVDTIHLSPTFVVGFLDAVSSLDDSVLGLSKALSDSSSVSDAEFYSLTRAFEDSISSLDALVRSPELYLLDDVSGFDSLLRDLSVLFEEASVLSDTIIFTRIKDLFDSVTVFDSDCLNSISNVIDAIRQDFRDVLFDIMNEKAILYKTTTAGTDGFVDDIDVTVVDCIDCRIMPVSQKERNLIPLGNPTTGNMIGYFLPEYEFEGVLYEVEENDELYDAKNDVRYRVVTIVQRQHLNTKVVYIKAVLIRI